MYEFKELLGYIWATVMDAKDIIMEALENKTSRPDLAAAYYRVASNRLTDADMLIKQAEALLDKAEQGSDEDFDDMDLLWSADHKRILSQIGNVKIHMDMYR